MSKKRCFVIMSFDPKFDHVYNSAIKRAVEDLGLECFRLNDDSIPKNIPARIIRELIYSDLIIADVSEPSPNVFYELGISHTVGNKTILISQNLQNLPFDVKGEYTQGYTNTQDGIRLLYYELQRVIPNILEHPDEPSNIVQIAGRDYFDFKTKIRENLARIIEEGNRLVEFQKYLLANKHTDNSAVISELSRWILKSYGRSGVVSLVAIGGAAGLGKTTLSENLRDEISRMEKNVSVGVFQTDAFMMNRAQRALENLIGYDPKANDIDKASDTLDLLSNGKSITYRPYDHNTGEHVKQDATVVPADIMIVDGIHALHPKILPLMKLKIFLYASPEDAKEMKFLCDLFERNYTVHAAFQHAEEEYESFEKYVLHYAKFADKIIQINNYWRYHL